jgi:glycosyltransferase involved in cell wall biosynthesis
VSEKRFNILDLDLSSDLLVNLSLLFDKPTGIATYAANVFPYLKSLDSTLLVSHNYPEYKCYPVPANLTPAQGTKGHLRRLLWTQFRLPKIYRQLRSRLIFSPVPEMSLYSKCRSVVMVHDLIPLRFPNPRSPLTLYFRYYFPEVLRQAEHIICNSKATAEDLTNFFGIDAAKITPIPLAYDASHFRPQNIPPSSIPYFLYIGRHDPYKNLHRLIAAFARMSKCRDCQLWIAGSPDSRYTPKLQEQVKELGLIDRVKFLDYVPYDRLPIVISQAISLVFPTLWEGFGIPVLEAMGCGTPVITSNLSSLPEVSGDAAILVDPYNIAAISQAMKAIANDSNLRFHLSNLSLQQASKFSWAKTGAKTVDVLSRFL